MTTKKPTQTMTDDQIVDRIATEVMGWEIHQEFGLPKAFAKDGLVLNKSTSWNPLTDWNHWRQVEEKIGFNTEMFDKLQSQFQDEYDYLSSGLRDKCLALYSIIK